MRKGRRKEGDQKFQNINFKGKKSEDLEDLGVGEEGNDKLSVEMHTTRELSRFRNKMRRNHLQNAF